MGWLGLAAGGDLPEQAVRRPSPAPGFPFVTWVSHLRLLHPTETQARENIRLSGSVRMAAESGVRAGERKRINPFSKSS